MKVLMVGVNELYKKVLLSLIDSAEVDIVSLKSSEQALHEIRTNDYDLLCFSLVLSDTTGIELAKEIRQQIPGFHRPIVLLTSNRDQVAYEDAYEAGIREVVFKDDPESLTFLLKNYQVLFEKVDGRILYVEDSNSQRQFISAILSDSGADVTACATVEDALEQLERNDYDLIITDVLLGEGKSGIDFTRTVRTRRDYKSTIPVLALTSFDDIKRRINLFGNGVNDYIVKPPLTEELLVRVKNLIAQKRSVDLLKIEKEKAETANRIKGNFLATMSHEIRTPMNAIIGMTDMSLEEPINGKAREWIQTANSSAKDLLGIINSILDFSKVESGKIELENADFSLTEVLKKVVGIVKLSAQQKNIQLALRVDRTLPHQIQGDALRTRQVLLNLASNAIKFTPEGGTVEISMTIAARTDDQVSVRFEVSDTGIGIPPERMDRLFEPFEQIDSSTERNFGGTGLGLSISQHLVSLMGGDISVESQVGQGTRFSFTLPFSAAGHVTETIITTAPDTDAAFHQKKVLLVEDNPINQEIAKTVLRKRGMVVKVANNGQEALEALDQSTGFDIILMDFFMPVMGGIEATQQIRANPAFSRTPIIAMTASDTAEDKERALASGMNGYISKPFELDQLWQVLGAALSNT